MDDVNKTLFIPLYGKSEVSQRNIILHDPMAERIWAAESFPIRGKSKSKWLTYNMAMRARVFDDWTSAMLAQHPDAVVLHIGCGLDSRCLRVSQPYAVWVDCDLPDVIALRKKYFTETDAYRMISLDASDPGQVGKLPDGSSALVVLEGISMYVTNEQLHDLFEALQAKYAELHILVDVYTVFAARVSRYKNPINDVGVTEVHGVDDIKGLIEDLPLHVKAEHTMTPAHLVNELKGAERLVFRVLFTGGLYRKFYRLFELVSDV